MKRHPSRSVLRQMQDEPGAVAEQERDHVAACATCQRRSEVMATAASAAASVLDEGTLDGSAVDPLPALRRLRSTEPGVVAPKPTLVDRLRRRIEFAHRRALRAGAVLAVIAATMGTLVATGVASDIIKIFQPETFVAVTIDITSLGTFPDLTGYGSVKVLQTPHVTTATSLAGAASASGLHLLVPGKLPSEVKGQPEFDVMSAGSASFTFSRTAASGTADKLGTTLPALPGGLDGSSLTLNAGPVVVETVGSQRSLDPFSLPSTPTSTSGPAEPKGSHGLLGGLGGIPQLVIVQMKAPVLYSDGPSVVQYEDALLSMPGIPPSLASQLKALGDPSSTLPIPIPTSLASAHSADINGAPGLVIGDTTGIASGVIWQSHGLVFAVAGSLTDRQVVAIARSMR